MMKTYDCNKIFREIVNKYPKFVFINESKRKYNFLIFFGIIKQTKTEF